jgi:hypothetical protein
MPPPQVQARVGGHSAFQQGRHILPLANDEESMGTCRRGYARDFKGRAGKSLDLLTDTIKSMSPANCGEAHTSGWIGRYCCG